MLSHHFRQSSWRQPPEARFRLHFRPLILIESESTKVLVEQLVAIDVRRASERVGQVSVEEMWAIDDALSLVVGLH